MLQRVTATLALLLLFVGLMPASAQITVRDINALSQDAITALETPGANLTRDEIVANITNSTYGTEVSFRAVVLTDPLSSGLANLGDGVNPDRIHVYVRDVNAATMGVSGMGVQLVDGNYQTSGLLNAVVGDVIDVTGTVSPFVGSTGISMQVSPTSITLVGDYLSLGLDASILAPVTVTSADISDKVDAQGGQQVNWTNLPSLNGQFVRLENARVIRRDISTSRPNWLVSTDNGETLVNFYDVSLRYRNDRGAYPDSWNKRTRSDGDFTPPPPGAVINLQGYIVFQGDDPFAVGVPTAQILSLAPFADSDLEIVESPPSVANLSRPSFVPSTSGVVISADVTADPARTLTSVQMVYTTSDNATERTVNGAVQSGDTYIFPLPAQADGVFVTYWIRATDNTGATSVEMEPIASTRFLADGINDVSDIQTTASGGPGDSPFAGLTTAMDLEVTVMTTPGTSGLMFVQDDPGLGAWSGLEIRARSALNSLNRGDVIKITNATIQENFGVTRLDNLTFNVVSTGGAAYDFKTVGTAALQDAAVAEAHEGMSLRFENVTVAATNADAPSGPFGEFLISSDGTVANGVRVDDASSQISYPGGDPANKYRQGQRLAFVQGPLSYSFSNYKIFPESFDNISEVQVGFSVRDINALPQDAISSLEAAGAALTRDQIVAAIHNDTYGTEVTFQAVVLTDPLSSGLANLGDGVNPDRIHVYVRDVKAAIAGPDGMGVQLVDGNYQTSGLLNAVVGDVIEVTGTVSPFVGSTGISMQVSPTSITLLGDYQSQSLDASILDPVVVTSADISDRVDAQGGQQVNWTNLPSLNGQYVRLENARVMRRDISTSRPNWLVSTDNGETLVNFYDVSLRYRNDRGAYPSSWNRRTRSDGDFVPPPPGAVINLQGYILFQGDDPFAIGVPTAQILSLAPFADSDLEVVESPPAVANLTKPSVVPGTDPVTVTASVTIDPTRSATGVSLVYTTSADATEKTVAGTDNGDGTYSFTIPGQADGVFVNYYVDARDNTGASSAETSPRNGYRVLSGGITSVSHIQETSNQGPGDGPFAGLTTSMDLEVVVMTSPGVSGLTFVQDDPALGAWSGLEIRTRSNVETLNRGDVIKITNATIQENFGVTRLDNITFEVVSAGGTAFDFKTMSTAAVADPAVAEAHEGMSLRFENVTVTATNADAPSGPFGEFAISSDGTAANSLRVDDASSQVSYAGGDPAERFTQGEVRTFVQGPLSYSFSNYKLFPESFDDMGDVGTSVESGVVPETFALSQNYPNPFNPVTTISYDIAATVDVRLEVFDLLGRRVASLVNGAQTPGRYSIQFDARDLASGMYIYRLDAAGNVFTNTMLLLK